MEEKTDTLETEASNPSDTPSSEEIEIAAAFDEILIAVGNRDVQTLDSLSFENAKIAWTYLEDGIWKNKEMSIEDYLQNISESENPQPISEIATKYEISITEGRLANVIAPTVISKFGFARSKEINHICMMKENDQWKLLSVAWTVERIPVEEQKFDPEIFAQNYAQVWASNKPEFVAMFYEEGGSLQVNNGDPAIGRDAIANVAQGFMNKFPDMKVYFDSLLKTEEGIEFYWTLTGTDADPDGKGQKVKFSGFELWTMSEGNLIKESKGSFSEEEYKKQLEYGIE